MLLIYRWARTLVWAMLNVEDVAKGSGEMKTRAVGFVRVETPVVISGCETVELVVMAAFPFLVVGIVFACDGWRERKNRQEEIQSLGQFYYL